jgi:hypothetical protein
MKQKGPGIVRRLCFQLYDLRDFSRFSPPIGFGIARDPDLYDRPITDVMVVRIFEYSKPFDVNGFIYSVRGLRTGEIQTCPRVRAAIHVADLGSH